MERLKEKLIGTGQTQELSSLTPKDATTADPSRVEEKENLRNADDALQVAKSLPDDAAVDDNDSAERRLLMKIDTHIIPIMCVVYGLNYLDKTTLSYASVMGLETDLNLTKNNYQWLGSIFYFGYLGFEYPTNRLLQRLPLAKYTSINIALWGTVLACTAATHNFAGIATVRLALGILEASVTPAFVLITSQWYTKKEQGTRTSIWFSFNGFANVLGGLVAYGVAKGTTGERGLALRAWKILFLVWGLVTVTVGLLFWFLMPDSPLSAWFLSKDERRLAVERLRGNQQGIGNKRFKWYQFKEAFTDPQTWALVIFALLWDIPNGGISNFFSQLIVSFRYTAQQSLLYGCPAGAIAAVSIIIAGMLGDRLGQRIMFAVISLLISIVGMALIVGLPLSNNGGRLAGYYLANISTAALVALISLISSNVAGYTKKTTVAALFFVAYCAGNIIGRPRKMGSLSSSQKLTRFFVGPQTFVARDAPRYVPAEITILVVWCICVCDLGFLWFYYSLNNAKKASIRAGPQYVKVPNSEWLDLTDLENPELVYTL